MTDRIRQLTVTLERDFRDDDVECVVDAIRMVKGVGSVELGEAVSIGDHRARQEVRFELERGLHWLMRAFFENKIEVVRDGDYNYRVVERKER